MGHAGWVVGSERSGKLSCPMQVVGLFGLQCCFSLLSVNGCISFKRMYSVFLWLYWRMYVVLGWTCFATPV